MKRISFIYLLLVLSLSANCDYLVKDRRGFYKFNCGKIRYSKLQVQDINKRLFKEKTMPLILQDRKITVKFNHYKVLSVTQRLNQEQLELISGL